MLVTVHADVYADVSARRSTLGAVATTGTCDNATRDNAAELTATLVLAATHMQPVSLCDFEGLPVDHELPRASDEIEDNRTLTAAYRWAAGADGAVGAAGVAGAAGAAWRHDVEVEYVGGAQYAVRLSPPRLGAWEVLVWLGDEQVGQGLRLSVVCPAGLVAAAGGQSCGCPAGEYMPASAASRPPATMDDGARPLCASCPPGHWSTIGAEGECEPCAGGSTSTRPPSALCAPCTAGRFAPEEASASCEPCAAGTHSVGGAAVCGVCAEGYFLERAELEPSPSSCELCPRGAHCAPNSTTASLVLRPGFWRLSPLTSHLYACAVGSGNSSCGGGAAVGDASCAPGHAGALCEWCLYEQAYWDAAGARCAVCPSTPQTVLRLCLIGGALALAAVALLMLRQAVRRRSKPARKLVRTARRLRDLARIFSLVPKLKILFGFYQVATMLPLTLIITLTLGQRLLLRRVQPGAASPDDAGRDGATLGRGACAGRGRGAAGRVVVSSSSSTSTTTIGRSWPTQ